MNNLRDITLLELLDNIYIIQKSLNELKYLLN